MLLSNLHIERRWMRPSIARRRLLVTLPAAAVLGAGCCESAARQVRALPPPSIAGRTLQVGPERSIRTLREAAHLARDGDTVLVDAAEYRGDAAVWPQSSLLIRGEGGRANLHADGVSAEGKALFVVRGVDVRILNFSFAGARVRDRNGAGIRLERGARLTVENCRFDDNENGILTANDAAGELHVVDSAFTNNGAGDGQSHNLYVGAIGKLTVVGSYFARARVGHLLKTRARESIIAYSRLSSEDGTSSYELEFPAGGHGQVIGCVIQQGPRSENSTIVSFGTEGYRWDRNELDISFCTIVNDSAARGTFVRVAGGPASLAMMDNLLVGRGTMDMGVATARARNAEAVSSDFSDAARLDFRLRLSSKHVGAAGMAGEVGRDRELPTREYLHPAGSHPLDRFSNLTPVSPGAFQRLVT
jgi:hypothetical protein